MRIRGDSSSSLPVNANPRGGAGGGFGGQTVSSPGLVGNMRSRSPQRRISPTRNIRYL